MIKKPLIGVTVDYNFGAKDSYSIRPHYALRCNYIDSLNKAGSTAILLPYDHNAISTYLELIDGLMVVGGNFDINPKKYGNEEKHPKTVLNEKREEFEFAMTSEALKMQVPILGICNGMQLINVIRGGNLMQHITDEANFINHEQSKVAGKEDCSKAYHDVHIDKNSILYKIVGEENLATNSTHHQAVKNVGKNINISAKSSDGIIEAIEDVNHPFCVGVQWHPEFNASNADEKIFISFVEAAKKYKLQKKV